MSRSTLRMLLVELRSIESSDLFVADTVKRCIKLIEADLNPGVPHQRHSETSRQAAAEIADKIGRLEQNVLLLLSRHADGLTDSEGCALLNMEGNTYRPRRVTLADRGLVYDTGGRRMTAHRKKAVVWAVTPSGIDVLKKDRP